MNQVNVNPRCADEKPEGKEPVSIGESLRRQWIDAGLMSEEPFQARPKPTPEEEWEQLKANVKKQRMATFLEMKPEKFHPPADRSKIPNLAAWDEADKWDGKCQGLWIWSHETGRCKTRMLWRHFGRLHVDHGKTCVKVSGQALVEEYFDFHMNGNPRGFYEWILEYDVVMLDDLDKMDLDDKRAPRMCRELFDHFYEHQKPVLVTANEPISHFQKLIGASTARRMSDVCREIKF